MAKLSKRRQWLAVSLVAIIAAAEIAYLLEFPPFVPTPWQARAALVEAGCTPENDPIELRDGTVWIGRWKLHGRCVTHEFSESARNNFTWEISLGSPLGRWKLKSPMCRVSGPCP